MSDFRYALKISAKSALKHRDLKKTIILNVNDTTDTTLTCISYIPAVTTLFGVFVTALF